MLLIIPMLIGLMLGLCCVCLALLFVLCLLLRTIVQVRGKLLHPHLRQPQPNGKPSVVVAFFHPYCNAGGGGERVLWVAIRSLQKKYPHVNCLVYTGDTNATSEEILHKARTNFNIVLPRSIEFVFLKQRDFVEAKRWPHFTLLGQSIGSVILGLEALLCCVPDVYIDTMGYAFTLPLFRYIGGCKVGCYVHYPTISTDMLSRVSQRTEAHNNAEYIANSTTLSTMKLIYYHIFAALYGLVGKQAQVILVNSSWTRNHILSLWNAPDRTHVVYPPCDTSGFIEIPLRQNLASPQVVVSIAQFRPEKDHVLQIKSFHRFLQGTGRDFRNKYKLVLIGSCRNQGDQDRVENLRNMCTQLDIQDFVEFKINISFEELKEQLSNAVIGIHSMWNEHFGIGVVECMAAGTIVLAHDSGGPKLDIVVDYEGEKTGYLASTEEQYATVINTIMNASLDERNRIALNGRRSVQRFAEEEFEESFLIHTTTLIS